MGLMDKFSMCCGLLIIGLCIGYLSENVRSHRRDWCPPITDPHISLETRRFIVKILRKLNSLPDFTQGVSMEDSIDHEDSAQGIVLFLIANAMVVSVSILRIEFRFIIRKHLLLDSAHYGLQHSQQSWKMSATCVRVLRFVSFIVQYGSSYVIVSGVMFHTRLWMFSLALFMIVATPQLLLDIPDDSALLERLRDEYRNTVSARGQMSRQLYRGWEDLDAKLNRASRDPNTGRNCANADPYQRYVTMTRLRTELYMLQDQLQTSQLNTSSTRIPEIEKSVASGDKAAADTYLRNLSLRSLMPRFPGDITTEILEASELDFEPEVLDLYPAFPPESIHVMGRVLCRSYKQSSKGPAIYKALTMCEIMREELRARDKEGIREIFRGTWF